MLHPMCCLQFCGCASLFVLLNDRKSLNSLHFAKCHFYICHHCERSHGSHCHGLSFMLTVAFHNVSCENVNTMLLSFSLLRLQPYSLLHVKYIRWWWYDCDIEIVCGSAGFGHTSYRRSRMMSAVHVP